MDEDHAVQFIVPQNGLTPTAHVVLVVVTFPRPFNRRLPISGRDAVVDPSPDVGKLKLASASGIELDKRRDFFVDVILVSGAHRDDAPTAKEGGFGHLLDLGYSVLHQFSFPISAPVPRRSP
jgi:hypothetical protein